MGAGASDEVVVTPTRCNAERGLLAPLGASATQSPSAFGAGLGDQARLQLAINQLDRYKALFDRAAEQTDSHSRYHARVRLLEEGLAYSGQPSFE